MLESQTIKSKTIKLLNLILILLLIFSIVSPAQAAGGGKPLIYKGVYLTKTNYLTESDPSKQTSTATPDPDSGGAVKVDGNNSVPAGSQTFDIWVDKNIVIDVSNNSGVPVFSPNKGRITFKDLDNSSNIPISVYRLGDGTPADLYKQHLYFDTNLAAGHHYEIVIDGGIIANNELTLGTTHNVDFATVSAAASDINGSSAKPAPIFVRAETNEDGTMITATFRKAIAYLLAAPAGFKVTVGGTDDIITGVSINTDPTKIDLVLKNPVKNGQVVTLDFTQGSVVTIEKIVLDSFSTQTVTNNVIIPAPKFVSAATNLGGSIITVTFSKAMAAIPTAPAGFQVIAGDSADVITSANLNTDPTKVDLALAAPISNGQTILLNYTAGAVTAADTGVLASFSAQQVINNVSAPSIPTSARLGGQNSAQTAVQIADQTGWTGTAILSSSTPNGLVDALSAGPLAAYLQAPILLTDDGEVLNSDTKAELTKLNVKTVYVTSGIRVIRPGVLNQLTGMGIKVVRLGGADRFETSVNIAKKMIELGANVNKAAVVYAWKNKDALSIAPVASAQTEPILLSEKDELPVKVQEFLHSNTMIQTTDVVGGPGAISNAVRVLLPNAVRHYGQTAYDTNVAVLKDFDNVLKYDHVYVANGETAIDALVGAPLAAKYHAGIVLTNGRPNDGIDYITSKISPASVVTVLGNSADVPESVLNGDLSELALKAINAGNESFADFAAAGITGAVAGNITGYDTAIAAVEKEKGSSLTAEEIQKQVAGVNEAAKTAVFKSISEGTEVLADFAALGVTGAVDGNKADYDTAIAAAIKKKGSSLTLTELQAQIDGINTVAALKAINEKTEVFADFATAGITGAVYEDKSNYDTAIAEEKKNKGADLVLSEVQMQVDIVNKAADEALVKINNGKELIADFATAGVTQAVVKNEVNYDKAIADAKEAKGSGLTLAEVQNQVNIVNADVALTAINKGNEVSADFASAGVTGVNPENTAGYNTAIAAEKQKKGSDLTHEEVQTQVDAVNFAASLTAINSGKEAMADFDTAGITGAVMANKAAYDKAIAGAKKKKGSNLTSAEVQEQINTVNSAALNINS